MKTWQILTNIRGDFMTSLSFSNVRSVRTLLPTQRYSKMIIMSVVLLCILFAWGGSKATACPPGYLSSSRTFPISDGVNTCMYHITAVQNVFKS
jgi:hypothetical protein